MREYYDFLRSQGHDYNGELVIDGLLSNPFHRFRCSNSHKKSNLDATYKIYLDSGVMSFVCYKCGIEATYKPESNAAPRLPVLDLTKKRIEEIRKQNELYEKVAAEAKNILFFSGYYKTDKTDITHPYLNNKHIKGIGCVVYAHQNGPQELVIPFLYEGRIVNLERICWSDSEGKYIKRPLKGGRSRGTFAAIKINDEQNIVLVCEGYATAATLAMATNYNVVYTRGSSNIKICLPHIKEYFGDDSILIICADNDEAGRKAAQECANELSVLPEFEGDYNDWYCTTNDLSVIANHIGASISMELNRKSINKEDHMEVIDIKEAKQKNKPGRKAIADSDFFVEADGLYFETSKGERLLVSSYIKVIADQIPLDNYTEHGQLIEYRNRSGEIKQIALPAGVASDEKTICTALMNFGVKIYERSKLARYLQITSSSEVRFSASDTGWLTHNGKKYHILPHHVTGPIDDEDTDKIKYQNIDPHRGFGVKGAGQDWINNVGKYCSNNDSMIFLVSHALSSAFNGYFGYGNMGINFYGPSSTGKSTIAHVCASVFGGESFMSRSNSTLNGLEKAASQVNDCLLILDDLIQLDKHTLKDVIYLLGNGEGRTRMTHTLQAAKKNTFRVNFLTTFETTAEHRIREANQEILQGLKVRLIDIPSTSGKFGAFDDLHGFESAGDFADMLVSNSKKWHGTLYLAFLQHLIESNYDDIKKNISDFSQMLLKKVGSSNDGQLKRVATGFARAAIAGEAATVWGLTGWKEGEALSAAMKKFTEWVSERGGTENGEKAELIERVREHFTCHDSQYKDTASDFSPQNCLGHKKILNANFESNDNPRTLYYLSKQQFLKIIGACDKKTASKMLYDEGMLVVSENARQKYNEYQKVDRIAGENGRYYVISIGKDIF